MDERVVQFRVGVMVLATLIIAGILIMLFGQTPVLIQQTYVLKIHFPEAPGIMVDTPIRKSGILIGRVTDVELDDDQGGVWVTASIDSKRTIRKHEVPRITNSLLGDATIEMTVSPEIPRTQEAITAGEEVAGKVAPTPLRSFEDFQERFDKIFASVDRALQIVEGTGNSIQQTSLAISDATDSFRSTAESVQLTSDALRKSTATFDETARVFQDAAKTVQSTSKNVETAIANVESTTKSISQTSDEWKKVGNQVNTLIQGEDSKLAKIISDVTSTSEEWKRVGTEVNKLIEGDQSEIAKLMGDAKKTTEAWRDVGNQITRFIQNEDSKLNVFLNKFTTAGDEWQQVGREVNFLFQGPPAPANQNQPKPNQPNLKQPNPNQPNLNQRNQNPPNRNFPNLNQPNPNQGNQNQGNQNQGNQNQGGPNGIQLNPDARGKIPQLIDNLTQTSDEWQKLGKQVNAELQDENSRLSRLLKKTDLTLTMVEKSFLEVETSAKDLRLLINDKKLRANLDKTLEELPQVMTDARATVKKIQEAAEIANSTLATAGRNLENIEQITKPLGESGERLIGQLNNSITKVDVVVEQIATLTRNLNAGRGSVGQLLTNPDLYQNINASSEQIYTLLRSLRPILNDVRVFTDKIARHPETLGLRGAFRGSNGTK